MTLAKLRLIKRELTQHDYRYYILNNPIITDQTYDMLYKEYEAGLVELIGKDTRSRELEEVYPQWVRDEFQGIGPLG